jgi:glycosyltransferase involved in cell wall biosynthesis
VSPRVVIGAPLFNKARHLPEALDSLLAQTFADFALVLIDDLSEDETAAIARDYAARDPRVHVVVNERRRGMLDNTRLAFTLPLELHPEAEFWALGSDHDRWHPRWLESLVGLLDAAPDAVLAYPLTRRIDEAGVPYPTTKQPWRFDSRDMTDRRQRMRRTFRGMAAGDMIYGLFRAEPLSRVGSYRAVLIPDRLLLTELALHGTFVQAGEVLWERRFRGLAELDRQRRLFFLDAVPVYARLPWWLQHAGLFTWEYGVRAKGRTLGIGRAAGLRLGADYLDVSIRHRIWRRWRRGRVKVIRGRNAVLAPPVRAALRSPAVRAVARRRVIPLLERTEGTLERLTAPEPRPDGAPAPSPEPLHR